MLDLLRKIGVPATIAAVIAALVTMVPILFTVDERYAKASELKEQVKKLEEANDDLRKELAQAVGFQQAMVALIQQGRLPKPTNFVIEEIGGMMRVQLREPAVPAASAPSAPASAASAPVLPPRVILRPVPARQQALEKPTSWKELHEGLVRQQQRLLKE